MSFNLEKIESILSQDKIPENLKPVSLTTSELETQYTGIKANSGGVSGASVFIMKKGGKIFFLKQYDAKYIRNAGDRIIREVYAYIKLDVEFHSEKSKYDKTGVDFAKIIQHGIIDGEKYYMIMTGVSGKPLYGNITTNKKQNGKPDISEIKQIWGNSENIRLFSDYFLKGISILYKIFGENFIHYDLHPDNIFVHTEQKANRPRLIKTIPLIDFDLIDSDCFKNDLDVELTRDQRPWWMKMFLSGINPKVRQFLCFCFNYDKSVKSLNNYLPFCLEQEVIINYANGINNVDIRHWYVISLSLMKLNKSVSPGNRLHDIKTNLKDIYNRHFEDLKGDLPHDFDFKTDVIPDKISKEELEELEEIGKTQVFFGRKTRRNKRSKNSKRFKRKKTRRNSYPYTS